MTEAGQTIREAVGVFHDREAFQNAVEDLMSAGFDRSELSLLAPPRRVRGAATRSCIAPLARG